ncbi:MAG: hydroxymethylbilane synthase [Planctomycetota bacterium]|nr:MAG: hydroxymethylbilane synthase [Planctomycetota bacterium]
MKQKWKVGTRKSLLARAQTQWVIRQLKKIFSSIEVEEVLVETQGDKILGTPLYEIGDKGLFTKELDKALLEGVIDFAVHSLKDLPTQLPDGLVLAAVTERKNPQDVMVSHKWKSLEEVPQGGKIGTGSLRRKAQLLWYRHDLQIQELRGNIDTRLRKLEENDWDAIILAGCGLERGGYQNRITHWIPMDIIVPAVGQGSLGVVARRDDQETLKLLEKIDHGPSRICIETERSFLAAVQGGCQVPVAAYAELSQDTIICKALVATRDGTKRVYKEGSAKAEKRQELGEDLAKWILQNGGQDILAEYLTS